jgi:hypothetical protein
MRRHRPHAASLQRWRCCLRAASLRLRSLGLHRHRPPQRYCHPQRWLRGQRRGQKGQRRQAGGAAAGLALLRHWHRLVPLVLLLVQRQARDG